MKGRADECLLCEGRFEVGEVFLRQGDICICCDCADGVLVEDLMHLTGAHTSREMLTALGFEKEAF